ncbi:unnamed protein product [Boreogadus saida]
MGMKPAYYSTKATAADPISARIAGVFMIPETGRYQFTAAEARDACLRLNATIATREQMEVALKSGFQTCSFGWTDDVKKGIIPRVTPEQKCGKGHSRVGHLEGAGKQALYRFLLQTRRCSHHNRHRCGLQANGHSNEEALCPAHRLPHPSTQTHPDSTLNRTATEIPPETCSSTSSLPLPSTAPRGTHRVVTSRTPARKRKSTPATPARASSLSSFLLHPSSSSTSPTSTTTTTTATTTTTTTTTTRSPSEDTLLHSSKGSLGGAAISKGLQGALIVVGLVVLVVSIAAASWYCKRQRFLFPLPWVRPQQTRDEAEIEMSKQESDTHLQTQLSEEEKTEGKNASEAEPCVRPSDNNTIAAV